MTDKMQPQNWTAQANRTKSSARQGKVIRTASSGTPNSGAVTTTTTGSGSVSFTSESGYNTSREDGVWLIDAVAIAIGNISPPRGAAVRAMARLLTERSAASARTATALASEFAGIESEETCHAIAVLAGDGWQGSLAELLNAARTA